MVKKINTVGISGSLLQKEQAHMANISIQTISNFLTVIVTARAKIEQKVLKSTREDDCNKKK